MQITRVLPEPPAPDFVIRLTKEEAITLKMLCAYTVEYNMTLSEKALASELVEKLSAEGI